MFDAMSTTFEEVKIWRDPACPACGEGSPFLAAEPAALEPAAAEGAWIR
jgi:hypothetical protein